MSTPKFNPIQILEKAGVTIKTCFAVSDYLLRGEFKAVKVRGFDYKNDYGYPWDNITWFKTGTGSGDGNGNWTGRYEIELCKTPAAFRKRAKQVIKALNDAQLAHREVIHKCSLAADYAKQVAWNKASQDLRLDNFQDSEGKARLKLTALVIQGEPDES